MKFVIALTLGFTIATSARAQYGYIITSDGSVKEGYLRYQRNFQTKDPEIELWKTKNDKNPAIYPLYTLTEYAIKKDTFKILTDYRPFADEDLIMNLIELKVEKRGSLNLYSTKELEFEPSDQ